MSLPIPYSLKQKIFGQTSYGEVCKLNKPAIYYKLGMKKSSIFSIKVKTS